MGQLNFEKNLYGPGAARQLVLNGSLSFVPFNVRDSISFNNPNILVIYSSSANQTHTISLGLYSLNGASLSLANSASGSASLTRSRALYLPMVTSANQNITPGTWFFGLLFSTGGESQLQVNAMSNFGEMANAFPGGFIGGAMTESTNALPVSYATSNLNITGFATMMEPFIIITA